MVVLPRHTCTPQTATAYSRSRLSVAQIITRQPNLLLFQVKATTNNARPRRQWWSTVGVSNIKEIGDVAVGPELAVQNGPIYGLPGQSFTAATSLTDRYRPMLTPLPYSAAVVTANHSPPSSSQPHRCSSGSPCRLIHSLPDLAEAQAAGSIRSRAGFRVDARRRHLGSRRPSFPVARSSCSRRASGGRLLLFTLAFPELGPATQSQAGARSAEHVSRRANRPIPNSRRAKAKCSARPALRRTRNRNRMNAPLGHARIVLVRGPQARPGLALSTA